MNSVQIVIAAFFLLIAFALFLSLLHDILLWSYREGYARGRTEADNWWIGVEEQGVKEREKIWREEASQ